MGLMDDLDKRREDFNRNQENSSRLAHAYANFDTSGQGSMEFEDRVDFGLTFIEEPFVAYGGFCNSDALGELQGLGPGESPAFPLSSGFVTEWDQDERGFYIGCWIAASVMFAPLDLIVADLNVTLTHYFTFSGIGIKDVPTTDTVT